MLNIKVDDGHVLVVVKAHDLKSIIYELLIAVRGVIEGVAEKDKNAGECLLKFCQELLPQLSDPDLDLYGDGVRDIMDKAIKKAQKDLIDGDDDIMKILFMAILEDDKK